MKRYGIYLIPFFIIIFTLTLIPSTGAPLSIVDSKHNLSSGSSASIKAASSGNTTSEICVFCHTPHHSRMDAPLWNKTNVTGPYTLYNKAYSDVLNKLSGGAYPDAEDPITGTGAAAHIKTRICLSCHDGMIALGNLVNVPYGLTGDIAMEGGITTMPQAAQGYIGTNLQDDHPVAIKHDSTKDPELKSTLSGSVRVYTVSPVNKTTDGTGSGYVECTSCHNAHDNEYGNFLVDTNLGSNICTSCHEKTQYDINTSIHVISSATYSPPADSNLGTSVGGVKCMVCHFPHKSGITDVSQLPLANPNDAAGRYLLTFQQEQSCYNYPNRWGQTTNLPCHGNNAGASKNIQDEVAATKTSSHTVGAYSSEHRATEGSTGAGWYGVGNANKHVECDDCHNPHTAGSALHTQGTNTLRTTNPVSALYGAGGARVPSINWPTPGATVPGVAPLGANYAYIEPIGVLTTTSTGVTYEYEICLKCHSNFAWGDAGVPPNADSLGYQMTNQALEFNPNNAAYHPVVNVNTVNNQGTYIGGWNSGSTQTMFCSDCHTKENSLTPKGPHGSNNKAILFADYLDTYGTSTTQPAQPSSDLCFTCHQPATYNDATAGADTYNVAGSGFNNGTYNLHNRHKILSTTSALSNFPYRCVNCHSRVPHGMNRKALIAIYGDGVPYEASLNGGKITLSPTFNTGSYVKTNCTVAVGCH